MAIPDAAVDLLAAFNLKPYVIQSQALSRIGSGVWDVYLQFDTLDEAKAAFRQLPRAGRSDTGWQKPAAPSSMSRYCKGRKSNG